MAHIFYSGASLQKICTDAHFIIQVDQNGPFKLIFSQSQLDREFEQLCDVPVQVYVVGDLKFYAQMLGCTNMSGNWCMWCLMSPHEWKLPLNEVPLPHSEEWTIEKLKRRILRFEIKD